MRSETDNSGLQQLDRFARYRLKNRERRNQESREWWARNGAAYREKNSDALKAAQAKWRASNREIAKARSDAWKEKYPERQRSAEQNYRANHPQRSSLNRAKKKNAIPRWADVQAIDAIYAEAKAKTEETGVLHEVDHIVPINSKRVCGLHCEANLAILTRNENRRKNNRHWPDMW